MKFKKKGKMIDVIASIGGYMPGLQIGTQPFCCLLSFTMNQDRLSNMALLHIERDLSSQLWDKFDDLVIRFVETHHNSKIVLL